MKIYMICMALHLMAVMLWIGHMVFWSIFVGPVTKRFGTKQEGMVIRNLSLRYGGLGWPALGVLALSGLYLLNLKGLTWDLIASGAFFNTIYGKLIGLKLLVVLGMIAYQIFIGHRAAPRMIYANMAAAFLIILFSILLARSVNFQNPYWDFRIPQPVLKGNSAIPPKSFSPSKIIGKVKLVINSPDLKKIIKEDAKLEMLATGFDFIEGPVFNFSHQYLLFSDISGNKIYKWQANKGITVFREPSGKSNGLAFDSDGSLVIAEHANRRISKLLPDGKVVELASKFDGKRLNSPNDLTVKSNGAIYFTDPSYGLMAESGPNRKKEISFQGVYRIDPYSRRVDLLVKDLQMPNGIAFSTDEQILYVNDPPRQILMAYDIGADGFIEKRRVFATINTTENDLDGIKVDSKDNIYMAGPGGIWIWDKRGRHLGTILMPEFAANMNWGDADLKTLYITATSSLYRIRLNIPGIY
jgi:gluconolactonase